MTVPPEVYTVQDDLLIAIQDGHPLPTTQLKKLPPWRASMVASIAALAGVPLEQGTAEQLHEEARAVGGDGQLGDWWERA
jgi:hypothetical protein